MVNSYELLVIRNKCSIYVENFATRVINVLFKSRAIQSMTKRHSAVSSYPGARNGGFSKEQ